MLSSRLTSRFYVYVEPLSEHFILSFFVVKCVCKVGLLIVLNISMVDYSTDFMIYLYSTTSWKFELKSPIHCEHVMSSLIVKSFVIQINRFTQVFSWKTNHILCVGKYEIYEIHVKPVISSFIVESWNHDTVINCIIW